LLSLRNQAVNIDKIHPKHIKKTPKIIPQFKKMLFIEIIPIPIDELRIFFKIDLKFYLKNINKN